MVGSQKTKEGSSSSFSMSDDDDILDVSPIRQVAPESVNVGRVGTSGRAGPPPMEYQKLYHKYERKVLKDLDEGAKRRTIDESWRKMALDVVMVSVAEGLYGMGEMANTGYRLHLPESGAKITEPPESTIPVFKDQLEMGVRFPLHPFLADVLVYYNISLIQLTPFAIRRLLGFVWMCEFYDHQPNMQLFRAVFKLKRVVGNTPRGWWTLD